MPRRELRIRRGTALNKLHFPALMRYSEDIDLVRTSTGPIGLILDRLSGQMNPSSAVAATPPSRAVVK